MSLYGILAGSIWEMGVSMDLYGNATTPQVSRVHKTDHTLLLVYLGTSLWVSSVALYCIFWERPTG
jgi:hypothetical protein